MSRFSGQASLRRRSMLHLLLSSGLGLAGCGGGSEEPQSTSDAWLQRIADASVADGLAGVVLGEVTGASTTTAVAGTRRQGSRSPVQRTDRFAMGSNTKALACAAIAAMVERSWLTWDITMAQAFPQWAGEMNPAYAAVSLKDLLHHRGAMLAFDGSGTEEDEFLAAVSADTAALPSTLLDRRRNFSRWLLGQAPVVGVTPGRDFHYSNGGYALAASIAEARTGRAFESLFDEVLVQPLGLQGHWRSSVPGTVDALWGHEGPAGALAVVEATAELLAVKHWLDVLAPAGHWACSGDDYARWLRWHTAALRGTDSPLPRVYVNDLRAADHGRYVWGWQSLTTATRVLLTHTGHVQGFMAEVIMDTRGERALFGASNTGFMAEDSTSWVLSRIDAALADILRIRVG